MTKPFVLLFPGANCPALWYRDIVDGLKEKGYDAQACEVESSSRAPPLRPAGLYDDARVFSKRLQELTDGGRDVVVWAHSYGGMVAREAVRGFGKPQRAAEGKPGGVVCVIYISALLGGVGESGGMLIDDLKLSETGLLEIVVPDEYARQKPEISARMMFSDMSQEDGIRWAARLSTGCFQSIKDEATGLSEQDKKIPITYIKLTKDNMIAPWWQQRRIEFLKSESGDGVSVIELETGHMPMVSTPSKLLEATLSAIESHVG